MRVALVDANDIAAGTSSRSSKLVHGGMRYLAAGQVGVVREAATERAVLRRIAPHLAQPMPLVVPARSRGAMMKLKAAMLLYERLGEVDVADRHQVWDANELHAREPAMRTEGLRGAVVYPEYLTDDARLTLANARSASAHGAIVATYARVDEIICERDLACGARVRGTLVGEDRTARIRAKRLVNASGPWLDAVRALEAPEASLRLKLTKGIHVTLYRERLPICRTVIMTAPDNRSVFVVPREGFVYFGTTDTFYPDAEYWPGITREDIRYLLDVGEATFDAGPFGDDDIVSLWSGVRPLLAQEGRKPSEISRRNETLRGPYGVLSIAGGKLTSYRSMAERIVDEIAQYLDTRIESARTCDEPLPGGDLAGGVEAAEEQLRREGIDEREAERLVRLYGAEARQVVHPAGGPRAEAAWAVLHEGALTLEDYWVRRSARARFDVAGGVHALVPAADAMAELLGWDEDRRDIEIAHCLRLREREMAPVTKTESELGAANS